MDVHESSENPRQQPENNDGTNRHGKSKSSWGLSSAVHAVHGVGFVAKKVINNRLTDSLWHSRKSTSTASVPSDIPDAKRENHSHETAQPSLNVADEQTPKLPVSSKDASHDCTAGSDVVDRSDDTKPTDGSHVKPVNQHRWPSSSNTSGSNVWPSTTGSNVVDHLGNPKPSARSHVRQVRWPSTTGSNVVNQSENLEPADGSHARPVNQRRWPGTVGSNVLNKSINHAYEASRALNLKRKSFPHFASKPLPESSSDASNVLPSRGVSPSHTRALTPARDSPSLTVDGVNPAPTSLASTKGVKPSPVVRGDSLTPATRSASDTTTTRGVSPLPATRGVSPSPATTEASPTPTVRGSSPTPSRWLSHPLATRGVSPTPTRGVSPTPTRGASPTPTRGVSPTPTRGVGPRVRDVSPTPVKPSKPSSRRHFFNANILSVFTKIVDNRKEKNLENLKEVAQHLELLYNIQVQWQFANASAEAALDLQRATAEKSLFDMWRAILDLRDSLASKKIDIDLLILQLKLYAVLYRQMAYIDEWASIRKEHESALFATTNDLQARSLSLPITGGVKADIKGLKLIVFSTIQVLQATVSCIQSTVSKLDKTHFLASELANLVLHERALLDECEIFMASAAPLHIEECSLRSFLLQSNRTSMIE
ncbi:hypothetical protein L1987_24974 [Smallanthus sonchifolius]|uniref:Uncharacterized protein n=1 Tax=Smallanthus sonchifolius TaxID=185202 RepID=A0ACB9ILY9_9ASTR|nr:hypothetical protein L1987_24974 [Smallanthus sonchifolius]